ncbi:MAG: hypothetical protein U1F77_03475 [Kiritimatiellia bacterium]
MQDTTAPVISGVGGQRPSIEPAHRLQHPDRDGQLRCDADPHLRRRDGARFLPANTVRTRTWTATDKCDIETAGRPSPCRTRPSR